MKFSKMKIFALFLLCVFLNKTYIFGQSFNEEKTNFSNFIKRMYTSKPFEGVKIVDDYDHQYLMSVISLEKLKYTNEVIMNRVAQVKSQSQANTFLNGATISSEMVISAKETIVSTNNIKTFVESIEKINQNSVGFSQGLELLINFDNSDNSKVVYIYIREIKMK
jgi:hypothetical protein